MIRILTIAKKVLQELLRDKRSLALMFIAPILIMWLMNVMFSANDDPKTSVATVSVSQSIKSNLDKVKGVSVVDYKSRIVANADLKDNKVDAVIYHHGNEYDVTYANTDSSKTLLIKQALNAALTRDKFAALTGKLNQAQVAVSKSKQTLIKSNPQVVQSKPQLAKKNGISRVPKIKITNHYNYGNRNTGFFAKIVPILLGFFVFLYVFLISGMALLKERTSGTLKRLLATPVKRGEIVYGYMIGYGLVSILQAIVIVLSTIWLIKVEVVGSIFNVAVISFLLALVALAFGLLISTLSDSEFQLMQLIPLIIVPQIFFSGIVPLASMVKWIQYIGKFMPLTYAGDALTKIMLYGNNLSTVGGDIGALLAFLVMLLYLNIIGLKRYRKV